jgi:alpha-methylacyl-CoA racemase
MASGRDPSLERHWWNGAHPFYRLYETKDGRHMAVAAVETSFALALLDALDLSHLKDQALSPLTHEELLSAKLEKVFRKRTLAEWEERFRNKDFCVNAVLTLGEAGCSLGLAQFNALGTVPKENARALVRRAQRPMKTTGSPWRRGQ